QEPGDGPVRDAAAERQALRAHEHTDPVHVGQIRTDDERRHGEAGALLEAGLPDQCAYEAVSQVVQRLSPTPAAARAVDTVDTILGQEPSAAQPRSIGVAVGDPIPLSSSRLTLREGAGAGRILRGAADSPRLPLGEKLCQAAVAAFGGLGVLLDHRALESRTRVVVEHPKG